jgi:hypothetical protein
MKRVIVAIITIIVFTIFFLLGRKLIIDYVLPQPMETQNIKTNYGEFTIQAPVNLTEEVKKMDISNLGQLELHTFSGTKGNVAYIVGYSDYPEEYIEDIDPRDLLLGALDGAIKTNTNRKLLGGQKEVMLDDNLGIEATIYEKVEEGKYAIEKMRIYLVGNRFYVVTIIAPEGELTVKEMDEYLESFTTGNT